MRSMALFLDTLFTAPQIGLPVGAWIKVARERKQLAALTDRQLADIGMTEQERRNEVFRPFWDIPARRRDLR